MIHSFPAAGASSFALMRGRELKSSSGSNWNLGVMFALMRGRELK